MNRQLLDVFFKLLRFVICEGERLSDDEADFARENLGALYRLSKSHDLAHLIGHAVFEQNLVDKSSEYFGKFEKEKFLAIFRYEKLNYEFGELCRALEEAEIPFMPLKGSILRSYYPEPWMRTSCDIDVLVHQEDLDRAVDCLINVCGYTNEGLGPHDVALRSIGGVHIELHYILVEDDMVNSSANVLENVWADSEKIDGYKYGASMPDAMFYFYHITHMAKHFTHGGCGIRPFIDLWILDNKLEYIDENRDAFLQTGGLLTFANAARKFSDWRFSDGASDETLFKMQEFLISGGVYGTTENRVNVVRTKKEGKLKYVFSRIFIPYDSLKYLYPSIVRHRWLLPIMQVRRWFAILFSGRVGKAMREFSANNSISQEQVDDMAAFLNDLELK